MRSFSSSSALVRIVSIVTTTYSGCNIRDNRKKFVLCSYKWTKSATCSFNNPRCGNRGIKTLWDMCQDSSILSFSLDPFVFLLSHVLSHVKSSSLLSVPFSLYSSLSFLFYPSLFSSSSPFLYLFFICPGLSLFL